MEEGCAQLATSPTLDAASQTNGSKTLEAITPVLVNVRGAMVEVVDKAGQLLVRGTIISDDGYFLTKASELRREGELRVTGPDGKQASARRVHEDRALDLLLAKMPVSAVIEPTWAATSKLQAGEWVVAGSADLEGQKPGPVEARLGVISATSRPISSRGAGLGVQMMTSTKGGKNEVMLTDVAVAGPALDAGLQAGDVLLEIGGEKVSTKEEVKVVMLTLAAGQEVAVRFRRGKSERTARVRLASLRQLASNFEGEDYGNGGVSVRTDGFPRVLQHATPLHPQDMGGALYDLDGNAVGINIARADRVTTFALPMEVFWTKAQEWMRQDRESVGK
ncbi:MAG: PDZ domain-containing protein [Verrucomicrobiaceae bacterium]|nr:PDZ domain-containing protein [Verrucomicrobiaceae bacterium]